MKQARYGSETLGKREFENCSLPTRDATCKVRSRGVYENMDATGTHPLHERDKHDTVVRQLWKHEVEEHSRARWHAAITTWYVRQL